MLFYVVLLLIIIAVITGLFLYYNSCNDKNKCLDKNDKCINIPLGYVKQNNKCIVATPTVTPSAVVDTTMNPTTSIPVTTPTPIPVTVSPSDKLVETYKQLDLLNLMITNKTIITLQNIKQYLPNSSLEQIGMFAFIFAIMPETLPDTYYNDIKTKLFINITKLVQIANEELINRQTNNTNIEETETNSSLIIILFGSAIVDANEEKFVELLIKNDPDINKHIEDIKTYELLLQSITISDPYIITTKNDMLSKIIKIKTLLQNKLNTNANNNNGTIIEGFSVFEKFAPF